MTEELNAYGQPIGMPVSLDLPRPAPERVTLKGQHIWVVPMSPHHAQGLFDRVGGSDRAPLWTYMPDGPPMDVAAMERFCDWAAASADPMFFTLLDAETGAPLGFYTLLRHDPEHGVVEIGWILLSKALQSTTAATEAMWLLMRYVFETLGYRRYEWKCDALNAPSRRAAERLGFTYEGTFRQARVTKGRNRDTAWFSIMDHEWPAIKAGFETWLSPENFDTVTGRQWRSLSACRAAAHLV
ncbi:MAG: GNAT family protein [Pseudomonadota bacterium]